MSESAVVRRLALPLLLIITAAATPPTALAQSRTVPEWLIIGEFPSDTGRLRVEGEYLGATATLLPSPGDTVAGRAVVVAPADSLGGVDLNDVFPGGTDHHVAYAHTYVRSAVDRTALLVMDSDDDLAAWVNGQRVWIHIIARGLGPGRDTATVRLAKGWNTILLEAVNRTGGFGVLGRLAPVEGTLEDLTFSVRRPSGMTRYNLPASMVAAGPVEFGSTLLWRGDSLRVRGTIPIRAWGGDTLRDVNVTLRQGRAQWAAARYARLAPGEVRTQPLSEPFAAARLAALGRAPVEVDARWRRGRARDHLPLPPEPLLRLFDGRIALFEDSTWIADSTGPIAVSLVVPVQFDGLSIDLLPRGLGPGTRYTVNGERRSPANGSLPLCSPCRTGARLDVTIAPPSGHPRWLPPVARIREGGYVAYRDGATYAAALTGGSATLPAPDPTIWLAAVGNSDGAAALRDSFAGADAAAAARVRRDTMFLVGNSHIDAAWLWRWTETLDVIHATWGTSLKLAQIFPGYRFAASSAAYYDAMDRFYPAFGDSLVTATKAGVWSPVGGWWVEADQNIPSGESLVRQGLYGQRYFQRRLGKRSHVAWTPDTFGYAWTLPQILRLSGFDEFVTQKIRWNDSTVFPYDQFWWESPDGTRIFTYNPYGYSDDLAPAGLVSERLQNRERAGSHDQMILYGVGDHGGGPTIAMLERAQELRRAAAFPALPFASPEEALGAIRTEAQDSFPVWRDELYLEYHRGTYTTHGAIKRRNRESEARLEVAEALAAVDTAPYPRDRLERAWRQVLFNQFHDVLPGSGIDSVYVDAHARYDTAWAILDSIEHRSLASLAARMDTRGRGQAVVVFNALGWPRRGTIEVNLAGRPLRVTADVPAAGAVVVHVPQDSMASAERDLAAPRAGPNWIENAFLRVEVDTLTGAVTRIYDKRDGREALAPGGRANVLQVFDDRPAQYDAWNIRLGEMWEITDVHRAATRADDREASIEIERSWGGSTFRQRLVLGRASLYLDVDNDVDWHERHKMLKVAFELAVAPDSATYEIPYGTIGRSGRPRTQAERAKFEVPGQRWADVSQGGFGVTILNDSKYGWDYRGNRLRLSLLRAPTSPDSTADRGRHAFRFAVYPHAGDWRAAGSDRVAAEYNVPLVFRTEPAHRGALGRRVEFASAEPRNVQLAWLKRAEDSNRRVLRLVEWYGAPADVALHLSCRPTAATRATLLEDPGEPLAIEHGAIRLTMRPYEIATVLAECASD